MLQPTSTLKNPYYFYQGNSGTIYNISDYDDKIPCGHQLVAPDTQTSVSCKRQKIDPNTGKAMWNGSEPVWEDYTYTASVSTTNHNRFPSIMVQYKYQITERVATVITYTETRTRVVIDPETGEPVLNPDGTIKTETYEVTLQKTVYDNRIAYVPGYLYYWFQNLIKLGDVYNGSKFTINTYHDEDEDEKKDTSYMKMVSDSIDKDIKSWGLNGDTAERIFTRLPLWATVAEGDEIYVDGHSGVVDSVSRSEIKDYKSNDYAQLNAVILDAIQEKSVAYMDGRLYPYGKKIKDSFDIDNIIVNI